MGLVDWLPYDSIDVVFNNEVLYANRQNHHPACITYDFEGGEDDAPLGWAPLVKNQEEKDDLEWTPINSEILFDPDLTPGKVARMEMELVKEMEENMRLYRGKHGND